MVSIQGSEPSTKTHYCRSARQSAASTRSRANHLPKLSRRHATQVLDPAFPPRPWVAQLLLHPSRASKSTASQLISAALTITPRTASSSPLYPLIVVRPDALLMWLQSWHHTSNFPHNQMLKQLSTCLKESMRTCGV